jgi:hypothetical protein
VLSALAHGGLLTHGGFSFFITLVVFEMRRCRLVLVVALRVCDKQEREHPKKAADGDADHCACCLEGCNNNSSSVCAFQGGKCCWEQAVNQISRRHWKAGQPRTDDWKETTLDGG